MNFLKLEIERKQKLQSNNRAGKYVSRGELERIREKEYLLKQEKLTVERAAKRIKSNPIIAKKEVSAVSKVGAIQMVELDEKDIKARLRAKQQPVMLFGENRNERLARLQKAESAEQRSTTVTFKHLLEATEQDLAETLLKGESTSHVMIQEEIIDTRGISMELVKNDLDIACDLIFAYFKMLIREWERSLQARADDIKRSPHGKLQSITQAQTVEHLKPFWKGLKSRDLPMDVLIRIADICKHLQNKAYNKSNDSYIRLSIGNAPWPIGVTGSGIHERANDDKIRTNEVAHVLNDETQRKWIQGVKRLMSFAEETWPL